MPNSCGTCKWGEFQMTAHNPPRLKNQAGICKWPVPPLIPLPISITGRYGFDSFLTIRSHVWPNEIGCLVWKQKV